MTDEFRVQGTLFRFPTPPPDGGRGAELMNERREEILRKAKAVKPYRRPKAPKWQQRTQSGKTASIGCGTNALAVKLPKPAGWHGELGDGETGTVQMAGPDGGAWCVTDDGRWVLATKYGVKPAPELGPSNRRLIVREQIDRIERGGLRPRVERELTDDERHAYFAVKQAYGSRPATPEQNRAYQKIQDRWAADRVHYIWCVWHELYPDTPFDFECVATPNRESRRAA